ncbi:MAG: lipoyl(octanoyl) transferase LipB [Bdellovibrionia bacterium]
MKVIWLGSIKYDLGLISQQEAWEETCRDQEVRILGCEHPAVITLGKRADVSIDLKTETDIPIIATDRGGQATLHNSGQLVIYPVVPLRALNVGVKDFVNILLNVSQEFLLQEFSIETRHDERGAGLFTSTGKIVFCGLRIEKGVSRHGISINIKNDLNQFAVIRSCGSFDNKLDSVINHAQQELRIDQLFLKWVEIYKRRSHWK